jgi:hypothetical protein
MMMSARVHASLTAVLMLAVAAVAGAQTVNTQMWITSGSVRASARIGDTLYVGGNFLRVGPSTGCWVPVDSSAGVAAASYPKVRGSVRCVISDGSGGWYLGGIFDRVGSTAVRNLAHVLANGIVGTALPAPDSTVHTMFLQGRTLYLGGEFKRVGAATRRGLAAVDIPGASLMSWNPDANRAVYTMAFSGVSLFVGGAFDSLGGAARSHLGVVDGVNGAIGAWAPSCTYTYASSFAVRTLAVSGGLVYAGGEFDAINGITRNGVAAIDATSGVPTSWDPGIGAAAANVYTILVDTTLVYLGGKFTHMGGLDRSGLVAVGRTTGAATSWEQNLTGEVWCMTRSGRTLYVGGGFQETSWGLRDNAIALDLATGEAKPWSPNAAGVVTDIDLNGPNVLLAGGFSIVGGLERRMLAAFDLNTGQATSWDPGVNSAVYSMLVSPKRTIFVGGAFSMVGGAPRAAIAEIDPVTGTVTDWNAGAGNTVSPYYPWIQSMAQAGNTLYAGGQFNVIGGQARKNIAALDFDSGAPTAWDPQSSGPVLAMTQCPAGLFAGGSFGAIGFASRNCLALLDTATGLAKAWNPSPNGVVRAIAVQGMTVYVGGAFTSIGGQSRSRIAELNASSGLASAWNPSMSGGSVSARGVYALLPLGNTILAGGDYDGIGGAVRHDLAALDAITGLATSWDPNMSDPTRTFAPTVRTLLGYAGNIYAGGDFISVSDALQTGIAAIVSPPLPRVDWCNLQEPIALVAVVGVPSALVFGNVWMLGITETVNHDTGIEAQVGWGPDGSLPTEATWVWTPVAFGTDAGNDDMFYGRILFPAAGNYDYAYRFRYRWSDWLYGDLDGSGNGYDPVHAGFVDVLPRPVITGSILQWPPSVSITLGAATPVIYGRVWSTGFTDPPGAMDGLVAQLGYGPEGTDPSTSGAWLWTGAGYNVEVIGGGEEYMATVTPTSGGTYDYAYRFSFLNGPWTYSDLDGSANGYSIAQAGALTVSVAGVEPGAPLAFTLGGASPNPSSGERLNVAFTLPTGAAARLALLDVSGREVAARDVGPLGPGRHALDLAAGRQLAPGVYLVRLTQGTEVRVSRVVLLK